MGKNISLTDAQLKALVKKVLNEGAEEASQVKLQRWQQFVKAVNMHLNQIKNTPQIQTNPQLMDEMVKEIMLDCKDFLSKKEIKITIQ
jgi:arginine utilization protein RocB